MRRRYSRPPAGTARLPQRVRLAAVLQYLVRQVSALLAWHAVSHEPPWVDLQCPMALLRCEMGRPGLLARTVPESVFASACFPLAHTGLSMHCLCHTACPIPVGFRMCIRISVSMACLLRIMRQNRALHWLAKEAEVVTAGTGL